MRRSIGEALTGTPNVSLKIDTKATILYWLIFDANFTVVETGNAASPIPFALPAGKYLCEMAFGPAEADTTATLEIKTNCSETPFTATGAISNRPTATIDRSFKVC